MAVLDIIKFPDSRLRKKCSPVTKITPKELQLVDDMLETMYHASGIGLSAIQVGKFIRLMIADTRALASSSDKENQNDRYEQTELGQLEQIVDQPVILFNPKIISRQGKVVFKEGCLSFPSYYAEVKRSAVVQVEGLDPSGKVRMIHTDGVLSVCVQHEIDHLDGKLFIDHLSVVKAALLRSEIKKYGYPDLDKQNIL